METSETETPGQTSQTRRAWATQDIFHNEALKRVPSSDALDENTSDLRRVSCLGTWYASRHHCVASRSYLFLHWECPTKGPRILCREQSKHEVHKTLLLQRRDKHNNVGVMQALRFSRNKGTCNSSFSITEMVL